MQRGGCGVRGAGCGVRLKRETCNVQRLQTMNDEEGR